MRAYPDVHSFPTRRSSDLPRRHWPAPEERRLPRSKPPTRRQIACASSRVSVKRRRSASVSAADRLRFIEGLGNPGFDQAQDRKSTRLNSSHANISYAVFCLNARLPRCTLFPYTTLFRSPEATLAGAGGAPLAALKAADTEADRLRFIEGLGKAQAICLRVGGRSPALHRGSR